MLQKAASPLTPNYQLPTRESVFIQSQNAISNWHEKERASDDKGTSNYLLTGGIVFDGSGAPGVAADVRLRDGRIVEIAPDLRTYDEDIIDASGCYVTPGLIDIHTHVFTGVGSWSIEPNMAGLQTGVTTMLDAGTAGTLTYEAFERFIVKTAPEDIFAFLNISMLGCLQGYPDRSPHNIGELAEPRYADAPAAIACLEQHREHLIGMKVRLSASLAEHKKENEEAGLSNALEAASHCGVPLMVHHTLSNISPADLLGRLRSGDIYTHLYHPHQSSGFADAESVNAMHEARERGVLFDVGHGTGSFSWRVAEKACGEYGFWPDTISTDIHAHNVHGSVWDLPTTMSKLLYLGMPLPEVVRATTHNAARAMRRESRFGLLEVGREADITMLRLDETPVALPDVLQETRMAPRIIPVQVWKRGEMFDCVSAPL